MTNAHRTSEDAERLINLLADALVEALAEIEYQHADMLTPEERAHPRGSGWARVYDKARAAIAETRAQGEAP